MTWCNAGMDEARARDLVSRAQGNTQAEILEDVQTCRCAPKQVRHHPPRPSVDEKPPVVEPDPEELLNKHEMRNCLTGYKAQGELERQVQPPVEEKGVLCQVLPKMSDEQ